MKPSRKKALLVSFSMYSAALRKIAAVIGKRYDLSYFVFMDAGVFSYYTCDAAEPDYDAIADFMEGFDYILISSTSYTSGQAFELADRLKERGKKAIIGGALAICEPELCLKHFDYAWVWEGYNFNDIFDYIEGRHHGDALKNFMAAGASSKTEYVTPASYDDSPVEDYSAAPTFLYSGGKITKAAPFAPDSMDIETSKGCYFNCTFCYHSWYNAIKRKNGAPLVIKSSQGKMLERFRLLKAAFPGTKIIKIVDDNFFVYTKEELSAFVKNYNRYIGLPLDIIADMRSPDFIEKMRIISGIRAELHLSFGIQTGSERLNREVYARSLPNSKVIEYNARIKEYCRGKKITVQYGFIYCNPLETKEDIIKTIDLCLKLKGAELCFFAYSPVPSSILGNRLKGEFESLKTFAVPQYRTFEKNPFYYLLLFAARKLSMKHAYLLPGSFRPSPVTELLNRRLFAGAYYSLIRRGAEAYQASYNKSISRIISASDHT